MKKMNKFFAFLAIGAVMLQFTACNKEKVAAKNKTDVLVQNPWVINGANFATPLGPVEVYKKNATNNLLDASKISLTFKKDGTITATDLDGKALSGTWSFGADESKITLPPGLPFKEVDIVTLTEKNFDASVPSFEYAVFGQTIKGKLTVNMVPKF